MLDLMAVDRDNGAVPLYLHTVQRILREMRLLQQSAGSEFDYQDFKSRVLRSGLLPGQLEPLKQRLDTLESFMAPQQAGTSYQMQGKPKKKNAGSSWIPKVNLLSPSPVSSKVHHKLGLAIDNRGPFLSVHLTRHGLQSLQRLLWNLYGAGYQNWQDCSA
jgi:hypothetical protein